jgi:hypothetical protein
MIAHPGIPFWLLRLLFRWVIGLKPLPAQPLARQKKLRVVDGGFGRDEWTGRAGGDGTTWRLISKSATSATSIAKRGRPLRLVARLIAFSSPERMRASTLRGDTPHALAISGTERFVLSEWGRICTSHV